jgi:hypothetical protein
MVSSRQPEVVAMSVEVLAGAGQQPEFPQMAESKGWSAPGVRILVTGVVLALAAIAARVRPAGVTIIESRLTRLSYAPEIAQAMLRQQQATQQVVNTGSLYQ